MLTTLTPLLLTLSSAGCSPDDFAEPELLLADGKPLNQEEGMLFPSPVLFDIDRDGRAELICGDLWGHMWVYENIAGEGAPRWSAPNKLKSADGKEIKVSNW